MNFANSVKADLIAMYTHDRKLLARHFKTSIAKEVQVYGVHELKGFVRRDDESGNEPTLDPCVLKQVDVFEYLSDEQVTKVMSLGHTMRVTAGDNLGMGGESGDYLYVILEGEAHLTTHSEVGGFQCGLPCSERRFRLHRYWDQAHWSLLERP